MAFSGGDYADAERRYRAALTVFPDYYHALAGVGKVKAAGGDRSGAIDYYKRAIERFPDLAWLAALGDLYRLTERHAEAAAQYKIVTDIGRLNKTNGQLYSRQLALFYADHDREPAEASANAVREYAAGRRDIYGADALAWTALKSDKLTQARTAIKEALRLGTLDAMLFYHAGMIARAAGDNAEARRYLTHALALNPQFDPLQASLARRALQVRAE